MEDNLLEEGDKLELVQEQEQLLGQEQLPEQGTQLVELEQYENKHQYNPFDDNKDNIHNNGNKDSNYYILDYIYNNNKKLWL